jgi:flagellar assembly protein FliH
MSSSPDRRSPRGATRRQVLRDVSLGQAAPATLLAVDLRPEGLGRLDPARVDAAVAEGRERGYEAGWAVGHEEALAEARARATAEAADLRHRLATVLATAEQELQQVLTRAAADGAAVVDHAAEVALAIAEAVVGHEVTTRPDRAADAARRALAHAPDGVEVTLRLHPDDADLLDVASLPRGDRLTVVGDPALAPGDCVAEAGWTTVDARVAAAVQRARTALLGEVAT